jgi:hypothetical protein
VSRKHQGWHKLYFFIDCKLHNTIEKGTCSDFYCDPDVETFGKMLIKGAPHEIRWLCDAHLQEAVEKGWIW